jgi:hypothetical protein
MGMAWACRMGMAVWSVGRGHVQLLVLLHLHGTPGFGAVAFVTPTPPRMGEGTMDAAVTNPWSNRYASGIYLPLVPCVSASWCGAVLPFFFPL